MNLNFLTQIIVPCRLFFCDFQHDKHTLGFFFTVRDSSSCIDRTPYPRINHKIAHKFIFQRLIYLCDFQYEVVV
jgi:hypothetical protein